MVLFFSFWVVRETTLVISAQYVDVCMEKKQAVLETYHQKTISATGSRRGKITKEIDFRTGTLTDGSFVSAHKFSQAFSGFGSKKETISSP